MYYFLNPIPEKFFSKHIFPFFLPFLACPERCIYCAQDFQTGQNSLSYVSTSSDYALLLKNFNLQLLKLKESGVKNLELALYGGTFTALDFAVQEEFLKIAVKYQEVGTISKLRCSTRPDAVNQTKLIKLKKLGLTCIELGVQSFSDKVLQKSFRAYKSDQVVSACELIQNTGFSLGIQLMPGLIGMDEEIFKTDVKITKTIKPDFVRLYPCLVLQDTILAKFYKQGKYSPWTTEQTVRILSSALLDLWQDNISVIRLSLAPEQGLSTRIVAGPYHRALGDMIKSKALYLWLKNKKKLIDAKKVQTVLKESTYGQKENIRIFRQGAKVLEQKTKTNGIGDMLFVPQKLQGMFWGHKASLVSEYAAIGLTEFGVKFWNWPIFKFCSGS